MWFAYMRPGRRYRCLTSGPSPVWYGCTAGSNVSTSQDIVLGNNRYRDYKLDPAFVK